MWSVFIHWFLLISCQHLLMKVGKFYHWAVFDKYLKLYCSDINKPVFVHTLLQYCTMLIHCSFACLSSRILLDSAGILFWRFIVLLGLADGEGCGASPLLVPLSLFEPHALHTGIFDGLTRVQVGQGQPGSTTPEPSKMVIELIIKTS